MYLEFIASNSAGLPIIEPFRIDSDSESEVRATIAYFVYYSCMPALDYRVNDEYLMLDKQISESQKNSQKIAKIVLERHTELRKKMQTAAMWLHSDIVVAASRSTSDDEKTVLWRGKCFDFFEKTETFLSSCIKINQCDILHTLSRPEPAAEKVELTDIKKAIPQLESIALKQKTGSKK
jgi:hypothetical protein